MIKKILQLKINTDFAIPTSTGAYKKFYIDFILQKPARCDVVI